jgi:hypothetical protein
MPVPVKTAPAATEAAIMASSLRCIFNSAAWLASLLCSPDSLIDKLSSVKCFVLLLLFYEHSEGSMSLSLSLDVTPPLSTPAFTPTAIAAGAQYGLSSDSDRRHPPS